MLDMFRQMDLGYLGRKQDDLCPYFLSEASLSPPGGSWVYPHPPPSPPLGVLLQAIAAMSRAKEANPANLSVLLALGVSHTNGTPGSAPACLSSLLTRHAFRSV